MRIKKYTIYVALSALLFYVVLNTVAVLLSHFFLFVPPQPSTYQVLPNMQMLPTKAGPIAVVSLAQDDAKYTVLYSHANATDLGIVMPFLRNVTEHGFNVISYDYNGYGMSSGVHSEKNTYTDIDAVYNYLVNHKGIDPQNIIVMADTLGTGPSIYLAAHKPVGSLVLMNPYLSIFSTRLPFAWQTLLFDPFNNAAKISHVHVPLLIVQDKQARLIPFRHALKLYALANQPKYFYAENSRGHAVAIDNRFWQLVNKIVGH